MPEAVVDEFEVIEIEIHDRQPALVAARLREAGRHAIAKQNAIRKIGEHVVMRAILELLLGHPPLRDIAIIEHDRADARFVQHVLRESFHPDPRPVLVHETELAVRFFARRRREIVEQLQRHMLLAWMNVVDQRAADHFVFVVADDVRGRRSGERKLQIGIEERDAAPALFENRAEAALALFELLLCAFAFGDVADERGEQTLAAGADRLDRDLDRKRFAVRASADRFSSAPLHRSAGAIG